MPELVGHDPVRRSFARLFLSLRTRAQVTQVRAAKELELGRATINRLEAAEDGVKLPRGLVGQMADLFGADDNERELLLALAAETRAGRSTPPWWQHDTNTFSPPWSSLYLSLEGSAERIRIHFTELVPQLLQERQYAQAIFAGPTGYLSAEEIERRVESRLDRQRMLDRSPPLLEAIGSQSALQRMVGGAEVMQQQLEHILAMTERANVIVRIIPFAAGVHAGMAASEFTLLDFPAAEITRTSGHDRTVGGGSPGGRNAGGRNVGGGNAEGCGVNGWACDVGAVSDMIAEPTLAYVESFTGAIYTQAAAEVKAYDAIWQDLENRALQPEETRALISKQCQELTRRAS